MIRLRRRLMKTNQCPLVGASPRWRRTRADNPSKEQRISAGCVQSQIRPADVGFNITARFELEESPRHRAPALHPTTRPRSARPARLRQTSIRPVAPFCSEAYASKDRRYSVTRPATNRSSCAFEPPVRNARTISPIRSQCDAGIGSNHSFRSSSHSMPLCTKSSSQSTELHDWNDGLFWPLTVRTHCRGVPAGRPGCQCVAGRGGLGAGVPAVFAGICGRGVGGQSGSEGSMAWGVRGALGLATGEAPAGYLPGGWPDVRRDTGELQHQREYRPQQWKAHLPHAWRSGLRAHSDQSVAWPTVVLLGSRSAGWRRAGR